MEFLNAFSISGILIVITSSLMALSMIYEARIPLHRIWAIFCILVMIWGIGVFNIATTKNPEAAVLWWKIAYIGVIFIPVMFTHFVHTFASIRTPLLIASLYLISVVYLYVNLFTNLFISNVHQVFGKFFYLSPTPLYNSFFVLFILAIAYSHIVLLYYYRKAEGLKKLQIRYFFIGSFLGFFGGSFSFLPVYGIDLYPYPNIAVSFYPLIMGYSIIRHKLMGIRVITTQIFVVLLWVFIFVRTLLSPLGSEEQFFNILLLALTILTGVFLIRSVIKEMEQREKIESLARDLERTNADLERANERLKELDKLKSEFVSLATHQIRGPLTAIKGYVSLMLEGDYGEVPSAIREPIQTIFQSSQSLVGIVEDFLNVSRIEQGKMKYEFSTFDLCALVNEVATEAKPNIEKKGLAISMSACGEPVNVRADRGKIKQVIGNLLDNAVKYTPEGSITLSILTGKPPGKVLFSVKDTGIGIKKEVMSHLFQRFTRAEDAARVNILGTGLGLFVAREMVKAQGGRIWAESPGEGKGAMFFVELPMFL